MRRYYFELTDENYNELGVSIPDGSSKLTAIGKAKRWMQENGVRRAMLAVNSMRTDNLLDVIDIEVETTVKSPSCPASPELGNSEFHLRHHAPIRRLGNEEKALLQELVDERCRVITERYLEDRDNLSVEYMKDIRKPEFRAALSQYPVPYTDPRTVLYLESFDSLYQSHHDEMRRLLNICETLALKTNPHLDRVLGCNAQSHRCEPRF